MKVIILYASAGSGHRRAAEAVRDSFKNRYPSCRVELVDALERTNPLFRFTYNFGYAFLINHAMFLWGVGFWITSLKCLMPLTRFLEALSHRLSARRLEDYLIHERADALVSTHFLSAEVAGRLKRNKKISSLLFTVVTDFGVHPYWISEGTDTYIVAADSARDQLIGLGIPPEKIRVLGIPVDVKFTDPGNKDAVCQSLDIRADQFTVLIVTGSFGIGPIEEIVDLLQKEAQVLVVCANNKSLFRKLKEKNYPQVRVFGFINNIEELMLASDMIIAKPGGLTLAESLVMDLPPVFITAIYGQETENIRILSEYKVGCYIKSANAVKDKVLDFKAHPEKLVMEKENIRKIKRPLAAGEICDVVCAGSSRVGSPRPV